MLVLTRKPGEWISLGNDIRVVVLKTSDGQVKLAIDAPRSVPVMRGELVKEAA